MGLGTRLSEFIIAQLKFVHNWPILRVEPSMVKFFLFSLHLFKDMIIINIFDCLYLLQVWQCWNNKELYLTSIIKI